MVHFGPENTLPKTTDIDRLLNVLECHIAIKNGQPTDIDRGQRRRYL